MSKRSSLLLSVVVSSSFRVRLRMIATTEVSVPHRAFVSLKKLDLSTSVFSCVDPLFPVQVNRIHTGSLPTLYSATCSCPLNSRMSFRTSIVDVCHVLLPLRRGDELGESCFVSLSTCMSSVSGFLRTCSADRATRPSVDSKQHRDSCTLHCSSDMARSPV